MMTKTFWKRPVSGLLALALVAGPAPVLSQQAAKPQTAKAQTGTTQADAEARIRKLEAEVKALQRQVFPGSNGKVFSPEIAQGNSTAAPAGTPATSAVTDLLTRMDSVEAQLSRLTAQGEENANRVAQLEARLSAMSAAGAPGPATVPTSVASAAPVQGAVPPAAAVPSATPTSNGTVAAPPSSAPAAVSPPVAAVAPPPAPVPAPVVEKPKVAAAVPSTAPAVPKPAAAKPAAAPAAKPAPPSAQRIAAVKAVEKPSTKDPADDEYSYGFRLWEGKFYPEAQQQLQLYISKYPNHSRISWGRNLLGRAYLDDGKPREAAQWFLNNYKADQNSARAPDSLLFLAESMRQLKDSKRACIALGEFADGFPTEAAGRLKSSYESIRASLKCP